jgi:hypothetical protein
VNARNCLGGTAFRIRFLVNLTRNFSLVASWNHKPVLISAYGTKTPPGPPMTLGKLWHSQLVHVVAVVCLPILASGCAVSDLFSPVAPGKYDFLDCPSITKRLAVALYEETKIAQLMTRASEAADGAFVNAIVYQDQYNTARAQARELRKAGEVKKCSPSDLNPTPVAPPD